MHNTKLRTELADKVVNLKPGCIIDYNGDNAGHVSDWWDRDSTGERRSTFGGDFVHTPRYVSKVDLKPSIVGAIVGTALIVLPLYFLGVWYFGTWW